jgi:signal transduction histidine kinase
MKPIGSRFTLRHEHRALATMLLLLHVVLWWDFGGGVSRSLMLAHLGVFLLWQPLMRHEQRLHWRAMLGFTLIATAFVSALSWLLLGFWLLLLIGLVGGRVNVSRRQRYAYLVALVYLVLEFLIGWVPRMFAMHTPTSEFMEIFRFGLFALPTLVFFAPVDPPTAPGTPTVDLVYGITVSMLSLVVALGSLVSTFAAGTDYPVALIQSVLAIALFLLAVAWMWAPMAGFSGLGQFWERYVQNAGTPFELWLDDLQRTARTTDTPEQFLELALARLAALPWVAGVSWRDGKRSGTLGRGTAHAFQGRSGSLLVAVHGYRRMGTTLMLHAQLLIQLIGHFYRAKQSEREMARQAHLHAIYETGARMTHDIKNLLQSLRTMTGALEQAGERDPQAASRMVRRQLPLVTQRLQLALDKLQAPQLRKSRLQPVSLWWRSMHERNSGQGIEFAAALESDPPVPAELFDSVAENLIENARFKRQREPGIRIRVSVAAQGDDVTLRVSDDGSVVPPAVRERLFGSAVQSDSGLGIGLYQAARQAQENGYRLELMDSANGASFVLAPLRAGGKARAAAGDARG